MSFASRFQRCLMLVLCTGTASVHATIKLSGKIGNPVSDSIAVSYNNNRLAYYPNDFYAVLDKKGNFSLEFPAPDGEYVQAEIKHGNHLTELMLHDGDSLLLSADAARFDSSISYAGRGSAAQNFVAKHTLARGRMNQYSVKLKNSLDQSPDVFLSNIEKEQKEELKYLDNNSTGLPASFQKMWRAYYTYYNYFFIEQYPQMHEMMRLRRYTDTIPQGNFVVLKNLPDAFNDELLSVPSYLLYLTGIEEVRLKATGYGFPLSDAGNAAKFLDSLNSLAYKRLPDKSSEYFLAQSLYARIRTQQIERTRAQFGMFKKRWPNSEYLPLLAQQLAIAERLQPGQPAPNIAITMKDGTRQHLADLKGKVVYLTFWATWCKQCVGEMRMEKKVKDILNGKPVEFVYVSLDDDSAAAATLMTRLKIEGNFTWTKGGWYAPEVSSYGVQGLPARYLIDTDGKIAMQNPPGAQQSTEMVVAISKLY
jgi:thiol-disulfide isomerase/thioredoxin